MVQINLSMKQKQTTDIKKRFMVAKGEGGREQEGLGVWDW